MACDDVFVNVDAALPGACFFLHPGSFPRGLKRSSPMYAAPMSQEVSRQPLPQDVALALLAYQQRLPPPVWALFKAAFSTARKSYAPDLALKMAEQALRS